MKKKENIVIDEDEFFMAQLDFLRNDYDNAIQQLSEQKKDIHRLLAILIENDNRIPQKILEKYVRYEFIHEFPFD